MHLLFYYIKLFASDLYNGQLKTARILWHIFMALIIMHMVHN